MFNRLKEAAQEAKNKFSEPTDGDNNEGQFQCPTCMRRFNDPQKLIVHHSTVHEGAPGDNPAPEPAEQNTVKNSVAPPPDEEKIIIETIKKEKKDLWNEISRLKKELESTNSELKIAENTNDKLLARKAEIFEENENLKQNNAALIQDIATLSDQNGNLSKQHSEMSEKMAEMSEKMTADVGKCQHLTAENSELQKTILDCNNTITQQKKTITQQNEIMTQQNETITKQKEKNDDFVKNEKVIETKHQYLSELYEQELKKNEEIREIIDEKSREISTLTDDVTNYRTLYENQLEKNEQLISNQTKDASGLMDTVNRAEDQVRLIRGQLKNSEKSFHIEKDKNEYLSRELKITTEKLQRLDDHQQGIENTNQKLIHEFSRNESKCLSYQKSVEELNDKLFSLTKDFDEYKENNELEQSQNYEAEIEKLISEKDALCLQLQDAVECKNRNQDLESVIKSNQFKITELENVNNDLREKLGNESKIRAELNVRLNSQAESTIASEQMINEMISEREILEKNLISIKDQNTKMDSEISSLKSANQKIKKEGEVFSMKKQEEHKLLRQKLGEIETEFKHLQNTAENWKARYNSASEKSADFAKKFEHTKSELDTLKPKLYESEKSRSAMNSEIETLKKARDNLLSQSERLVIQTGKLEKEIVDHRQQLNTCKQHIQQLEKLKQSAIEKENEKHEELQLQKTKVEKMAKDFLKIKNEKKSAIAQIEHEEELRHQAENKFDQLEVEVKQLKIQHQNFVKEKASKSKEFSRMQAEYAEIELSNRSLSEKMSEAQATINELGRSLAKTQVAWEAEKSCRWVDDDQVQSCQKCHDQFTMLVRRHHCRKCGGIFCYNCSNFTLILPSSSKPQRVCESCCQS